MARIHIGETFKLQTNVVDRANSNLTDAPNLTLRYKTTSRGEETTLTPIRISVGLYSVAITPTISGNLYYRWDTDGTFDVAKEGVINVARSVFT